MNSIIVRDNPASTVKNLFNLGEMYHDKKGVKITWLLDYPTLVKRQDLKEAVLEFNQKYDDEMVYFEFVDFLEFHFYPFYLPVLSPDG